MPQKTDSRNLLKRVQRLARVHFLFAGAFAAQILIFDAWQLIAPAAVLQRWVAVLSLLTASTIIWYLAHGQRYASRAHWLVFYLALADIAFAAFAVYSQRGMASRAVALFLLPIIVVTALRNRAAILATSVLCGAAYITAAVAYFVLHFNEGYKIELYGEVGFYFVMFIVAGALLAALTTPDKTR